MRTLSCETGSIVVGKRIKLPESSWSLVTGIHTNDSHSIPSVATDICL